MDEIKLACTEYFCVQNPDGSMREGTPEERANFKPATVITYGQRDGIDGAFETDLKTGETVFKPFVFFFNPIEYEKIWYGK